MPSHNFFPSSLIAGAAVAVLASSLATSGASAQSATRHRVVASQAPAAAYPGLTITKPPTEVPDPYSQDDAYQDGPTRYNDIRDFSPFPYADSGRQFPFGFDGIGGYGSDLGYNEGQDAALYDRGAFNRDAR